MSLEAARRVLEIEADSVRRQIDNLGPDFHAGDRGDREHRSGRLCLTGIGKSGLIGQKIAATLASTGTPAYFLHAGEASHGDLGMLMPGDVVLALSYSGETPEVVRLLEFARARSIRTIAMTGVPGSSVARAAEIAISVAIPREACPLNLAPTASTTAMLAMGDALAMSISERRGFKEEDFAALHPAGSLGRRFLKVRDLMRTGRARPAGRRRRADDRGDPRDVAQDDGRHRRRRRRPAPRRRHLRRRPAAPAREGPGRARQDRRRLLPARTRARSAPRSSPRPRSRSMRTQRITSLFVLGADGRLEGALHMHDLLAAGLA